jgi:hypothetical protein
MSKRYIPKDSFTLGRGRTYSTNRRNADGTVGYFEEEVGHLPKQHLAAFRVVDVEGEGVEQATAAPGEKRTVPSHECSEEDCDFSSRTAAGIAAHERSH